MDIIELGSKLLIDKLNLGTDPETVKSALSGLLSDGEGRLDIAGLASKMASSGEFMPLISSWLGDGENQSISPGAILSLFGQGRVDQFSSAIGTSSEAAAEGLSQALPEMMDKNSSGGSLLQSVAGEGGLAGLAKSLFS